MVGATPPKGLSANDVVALLAALAADPAPAARRDRALYSFLLGTGARPGSALALEVGDVDRELCALEANLLEDLLAELDRPALRPSLHRRAVAQFAGDEIQTRRRIAEGTWALAARHREAAARNWRALLEEQLRED